MVGHWDSPLIAVLCRDAGGALLVCESREACCTPAMEASLQKSALRDFRQALNASSRHLRLALHEAADAIQGQPFFAKNRFSLSLFLSDLFAKTLRRFGLVPQRLILKMIRILWESFNLIFDEKSSLSRFHLLVSIWKRQKMSRQDCLCLSLCLHLSSCLRSGRRFLDLYSFFVPVSSLL